LTPGNWDVYVEQPATGCVGSQTITITQPALLIASVNSPLVCSEDSYARSIVPTVSGGVPPYSFLWSTGQTTRPIFVTASGSYTYTVTDLNGCVASATSNVGILPAPTSITFNLVDDFCGQGNGSATVIVTGGLPSFTYSWSNGATTATISPVVAGNYSVTIEDAENCKFHRNTEVLAFTSCLRTLSGYVVLDNNRNQTREVSDTPYPQHLVTIRFSDGRTLSTFTNPSGFYEFQFNNTYPDGPYTITAAPVASTCITISPQGLTRTAANFPLGTSSLNNNFYFWTNQTADLVANVSCNAGGQVVYCATNNGCVPVNGTIMAPPFGQFSFLALQPGASYCHTINVPNIACGTTYNFNTTVTVISNTIVDNNTTNNSTSCSYFTACPPPDVLLCENDPATTNCFGVGFPNGLPFGCPAGYNFNTNCGCCAYDPNRKSVQPNRDLTGGIYESDGKLTYTLEFQNEGNWFAYDVVLKDPIDLTKLNINTLEVFASSHPYVLKMENPNTLVFEFRNIMLPDVHMDPEGSKGFVAFTIERYENQPVGTTIENYGDIYFDWNPAVRTNTVVSTVIEPLGVDNSNQTSSTISIQPNPAKGNATVKFNVTNSGDLNINIIDISGKVISNVSNGTYYAAGDYQLPMNTSDLAAGVYMVQIVSGSSVETTKFVKID
jgi:Secretion system C-terminal sorting domain/SprB repeat